MSPPKIPGSSASSGTYQRDNNTQNVGTQSGQGSQTTDPALQNAMSNTMKDMMLKLIQKNIADQKKRSEDAKAKEEENNADDPD